MKNYEQKYKAALGWMQSIYKGLHGATKEDAEHFFPELKESEDENVRKGILELVRQSSEILEKKNQEQMIAWLEKQNHDGKKWIYEDVYLKEKEQLIQDGIDDVLENPQKYGLEKQGKKKPADKVEQNPFWSEDDERMIDDLCNFLEAYGNQYYGQLSLQGSISWLKSLKPQENLYDKGYNDGYSAAKYNHWKPSEKQMMTLCALCVLHKESKELESLYNDLKNL